MALAHTLALLAQLAQPASALAVRTDAVDPRLTETGLRTRVDEPALAGWTITVDPGSQPNAVSVQLTAPDGSTRTRQLTLQGLTVEDRSRELAASLALLLDEPPDTPASSTTTTPPTEPEPEPEPEPPPAPKLRGWLGLGPRLELGTGVRVDGAVDVLGGLWLAREHVQPIAGLGVGGTTAGQISQLHVRVGAGLALGAPLPVDRRIWLGGHVLTSAMWVRAHDVTTASTWLSSTEVGGMAQYRGARLFLGLRTGVDLGFPPLAIQGSDARVRRGSARWLLGLTIGVVFG